jgi:AcrR family transcriptional regulator
MNLHASLSEPYRIPPLPPRLPPAPRKRPKQSRSRMLVASLNEACLRIIRSKGELKVTEIAAVAGVAMGSIYQYFPNIEAIIANIYEEAMLEEIESTRRMATTEWRELGHEEALARMVRATLEFHRRLLDLDREIGRGYYHSFDLRTWFVRVVGGPQASIQPVRAILARRWPELGAERLDLLAQDVTSALRGAILDGVIADPGCLDSPEFARELVRMCCEMLGRED